jgi:hypothetical protein
MAAGAGMRYGNAMAKTGGAQFFAFSQVLKNCERICSCRFFRKQFSEELQSPFFAPDISIAYYRVLADQLF